MKRHRYPLRCRASELEYLRTGLLGAGESRTARLESLLLALLRRVETGELRDFSWIRKTSKEEKVVTFSFSDGTFRLLEAHAGELGVPKSVLVRAAILLQEELNERAELEELWVKHHEPGSPRFFSDSFLRLWKHHVVDNGEHTSTEARLYAALRTLEGRFSVVLQQLEGLEVLREYAMTALRSSTRPPTKGAILALRLTELRALGKWWGVDIPQRATLTYAQDILLQNFKYQR